jgi:hypothetical protein
MPLLPRRRRNRPTLPPAADFPAEPWRCTATTGKGTRCKLPAVPGSDRCLVHPHAPSTPAAV